jgi:homoserine dehydrogenase
MKKRSETNKATREKSAARHGTRNVRVVIAGLGNVGRRLLELLERKRAFIRHYHDLDFAVVGVADSGGANLAKHGFDTRELIETKRRGEHAGTHKLDMSEILENAQADIFVDLTPTNLKTGEPGLSLSRQALRQGLHIVTANKGPLVLAYSELMSLARKQNVKIFHSATVIEGIVNATTNYILTRMGEGDSFDAALEHAQRVGHAEANPSLDIDGWDAANKLVIIANAVLHHPAALGDVKVIGIRGITQKKVREAKQAGQVIKLVARAEKLADGEWRLSVKPMHLPAEHPLARVGADMMGVIYHTDINGTIFASIEERDPYPTAAAVLRDMISASR